MHLHPVVSKIIAAVIKRPKGVLLKACHPLNVVFIGLSALLVVAVLHRFNNSPLRYLVCSAEYWAEELDNGFEGFDNVTGIVHGPLIVPNYVHFLRYGEKLRKVSFMDAACILAAFKNQKPDKIMFHTNFQHFEGKYWKRLLQIPKFNETIEFHYIEPVESIFNQKLHVWYKLWHSSDILRIDILRRYGGIFIDNDVYLVQNMDRFRRFEMAVEIPDIKSIGTMTLVAHKDARFLRLWLNSYKQYYGHLWYYNAGEKPKLDVLNPRPELVHNAFGHFGVEDLRTELYVQKWKDWKKKYTIHTLVRHMHDCKALVNNDLNLKYPVVFDETNILKYNVTMLDMVMDCCKELLFLDVS